MGTSKGRLINTTYEEVFNKFISLKNAYIFFDLHQDAYLLDYGCGTGWTAMLFAQKVKQVYAIDISSRNIDQLKKVVEENSIKNIFPYVCDAEKLLFKDESFDFVFGNAILHHLHLDKALSEVSRVLKRGGKAAFCEPYGHNPILNLYRFVKDKYIKRVKGIHRPLKYTDKKIFEKYFNNVEFIETSFTSDRVPFLGSCESKILEKFPSIRKLASYVTILLKK
jgi:ubiquinone/menaquinone biosynthesis C-methylase UbiE